MGALERFADRLAALEEQVQSRTPQASHYSIVDGAIEQLETYDTGMVDDLGATIYGQRPVARFGRQPDGGNTVVSIEGPVPPAPAGYTVEAGPGTLTVHWGGGFADGAPIPSDFYAVIVHLARVADPGPFPSNGTVAGSVIARDGDGITIGGLDFEPYRVVLVTVTRAAQQSLPGPESTATPGDGSTLGAVDAMQSAVDQAIQDAADALAAADGAVTTYFQTTPPLPAELHEGDLWFDTDDGNKLYRWDETGTTWVVAADQRAADAITAATNAVTIANSRIKSYYQNDPPAGANVGDLWVDTNDGNRLYRWNGSAWQDARDGTIAAAALVASNALNLAGQKGKVYRQSTAPTGASTPPPADGDLWYDTTTYTLKQRASGTWVTPTLDAGVNVRANTVTASLLASEIVLSTKIVAGPLNDSHTELDPTGLSLFQKSPEGLVQLSSRLGSPGADDFLQVYSATDGRAVASIDQEGGLVASTAAIGTKPGDTYINGVSFEGHFAPYPLGAIAYGSRRTNGTAVLGGANIARWLEVQTVLAPDRLYRVSLTPTYTVSATAGARCVFALFYAAGGASAVTTSGQLNSSRHAMPLASEAFTSATLSYTFDTTPLSALTEYRFLTAYYGEGAAAYPLASGGTPSILTVEDLGPAIPDIGIDGSAAPPPAGIKQVYTTFWQASTSGTYQGGGARRYDTNDLVHGTDPSGFNGNGAAIAVFGAGAYYSTNPSEVGKSITTALTGSTIIAADVAIKCSHAYYSGGMTVYYNTESRTSLPATFTNSTYYGYSAFAVGQAKYVPVAKMARTSLTLGSPPGGLTYYGRLNSHSQGYPPVIRYVYKR